MEAVLKVWCACVPEGGFWSVGLRAEVNIVLRCGEGGSGRRIEKVL
jgi:hypothetical protein